jgi:hypothetical protein
VIDTTDTPHNFSTLEFLDMEGDCKEGSSPPAIKNDDDSKITQLFTILSQQITRLSTQNMAIQDQLHENENMLLTRFQTVVQDNETFQQSLRAEMDELCHLISSQTQPTCPPRPVPLASHTYVATNSTISDSNGASNQSSPTIPTTVVSPPAPISIDPQANMLLLLAESFTKLTSALNAFLHFPLSAKILAMSDANWGPQDASRSISLAPLPLFVSQSMSAFFIDLLGLLHWVSKRQAVTAVNSAEAEIYATNECVRFLLELVQIFDFLGVRDSFMPGTNVIYNDNRACIDWSHSCTTKGLRHIKMKENQVRENIVSDFISIQHVEGKINLADIFTKEMKDVSHFVELRDIIMCQRFLS